MDAPTARVGESCSELTIVVRNGSNHMVRIALTARLRYGPDMTSAATYVATAGHADHATAQYVDPGEVSYPYTLGFVLPAEARETSCSTSESTLDARTCGVRRFDRCRLALAHQRLAVRGNDSVGTSTDARQQAKSAHGERSRRQSRVDSAVARQADAQCPRS